jgi:hypothetical protein
LNAACSIPLQFSQKLLAHNVPGALSGVKMLHAFSVPTLDSATSYSIPYCENWRLQIDTGPMHLKICPLWSWQSMRSKVSCRAINGELSCNQRWAVVQSTVSCRAINGELSPMQVATPVIPRHLPLLCLCDVRRCPHSDVISELRQRVAVDTLMTSHYSGDVTWIRTEVRVVGRNDATRLKEASKSIFLTIFKMLTRVSVRKILKGGQNPGAEFFARNLKYLIKPCL